MLITAASWSRWRRSSAAEIPRVALVVVGRFDQEPSRVRRPGLGDRTLPPVLAGGVLRRDDPEVCGELVGVLEAVPLADLGAQPER
jgi:hypothetical protein